MFHRSLDETRSIKELQEKFQLTQIHKNLEPRLELTEEENNTISVDPNWFLRQLDSGESCG